MRERIWWIRSTFHRRWSIRFPQHHTTSVPLALIHQIDQGCNKSRGGFDTVELLGSGILAHENVPSVLFFGTTDMGAVRNSGCAIIG